MQWRDPALQGYPISHRRACVPIWVDPTTPGREHPPDIPEILEEMHWSLTGGRITTTLALTDALRNVLLPGHPFDSFGVAPPIGGTSFDAMLADRVFDSS